MKKILLLGDSIRRGYDRFIKYGFEDSAVVYYPEDNCRFTTYFFRCLNDWKTSLGCGDDVDLVHWNAGLWDCLIMLDGKPLVGLEEYKANIERICNMMKLLFPKAKFIFATSTPVFEAGFSGYKRYNKDIEEYNRVAVECVTKYGMEVNDLYALLKDVPYDGYHSDQTHYYTVKGTQIITSQVADCIESALGIKAKHRNFGEKFDNETKVVGI